MKKLFILSLLLIVCMLPMFGENEHMWRSFYAEHSEDGYIFRMGVEKRYFGFGDEKYYQHFEAQVDFSIYEKQFYLGVGFRTIDMKKDGSWIKEHRPMINAVFKYKRFKNRSRLTYRMRADGNIWRFRNKASLVLVKPVYVAYEVFADYGEPLFYRNRMSVGVKVGPANIHYLLETISGEIKSVIGTYFKVKF